MKLTIIGPAHPLRGGIAHHVYWLQQQMKARRADVQVISFTRLYPKFFFPGTTEFDTSRLKLDVGARALLDPLNPLTWLKAFKEVKRFSPDVVIIQWWNSFFSPVIGSLTRLIEGAGFKCVIECHNVLPHERTPLDLLLLHFAFAPADHFITHSTKDRSDLLEVVPNKDVRVAPLPPLEEFSGGGHNRQGRTILFFGLVRKYKGLDILLRAMPRVLAQMECNLKIVGEFYDPVENYTRLIRELKIEPYVQIENRYVSNEEVPAIFDQADVLALPYLNATQSGVAQIAIANGLPIIASNTGGLSEVVIDNVNGLLFPPGDWKALAEAILNYFSQNLGPRFASNILNSKTQVADSTLISFIETLAKR